MNKQTNNIPALVQQSSLYKQAESWKHIGARRKSHLSMKSREVRNLKMGGDKHQAREKALGVWQGRLGLRKISEWLRGKRWLSPGLGWLQQR